jgi:hypothetical protein
MKETVVEYNYCGNIDCKFKGKRVGYSYCPGCGQLCFTGEEKKMKTKFSPYEIFSRYGEERLRVIPEITDNVDIWLSNLCEDCFAVDAGCALIDFSKFDPAEEISKFKVKFADELAVLAKEYKVPELDICFGLVSYSD